MDQEAFDPTPDGGPPLLSARQLRLFDLLHRTQSVTRTAERMGTNQPTVSNWLRALRAQLGDDLFVRTPSGMQATPRADALVVVAREALAALHRLSAPEEAFDPVAASRRFRICMTDASHVTLLPRLLAHLRGAAPGVRLEAARIDARTAESLQAGESDLAIGLVPGLESGFYQQVLYPQDWVCLANPGHPRVGGGARLDRAAYEAEAHVGIVGGTGAQLLDAALARHGVRRRVLLELPGFLGLAAILSTTDLIATLPRQIGQALALAGGLSVLDCPVPVPPFQVKQHWHARYHQEPGNRWLRGLCASLFEAKPASGRRRAGASGGAPPEAGGRR